MLSAAGSGSWVERRLRLDGSTVVVEVGPTPDAASDLQLGRIAADGFTAAFRGTARPAAAHTTADTPAAPETATRRARLDGCHTRGRGRGAAGRAVHPVRHRATGASGGRSDRADRRRPARRAPCGDGRPRCSGGTGGRRADRPVERGVARRPRRRRDHAGPGRPVRQSGRRRSRHADPPDEAATDETAPFIVAIRCGRGHANPTHVSVCRTCGDLLPLRATPETIRQPPLALLEAGGATVPIDRTLVVGRRPDVEAAAGLRSRSHGRHRR